MPGGEKEIETLEKPFCRFCSIFKGEWLRRRNLSSRAFILLALLVFAVDRLSKLWIMWRFLPGESLALIPNIFYLTYILNPGAAFGILPYKTSFFVVATFLMILLIVFSGYFLDKRYALFRLALALQLGGALGNLYDRLKTGYVVDFLDFRVWPVFNLADTAIVAGILLMFLNLLCNTSFFIGNKR